MSIKHIEIGIVEVYVDGACTRNGKQGARAGSGVYFGSEDPRNSSFKVPGKQTNQRAEVWAIIQALDLCPDRPLRIYTDSVYAWKGATRQWHMKQNLDLFEPLWEKLKGRVIDWKVIRGHTGIVGNEAADKLAKQGI